MFQKLIDRLRKSPHKISATASRIRRNRHVVAPRAPAPRTSHDCLAWKEGDWWFCRTTTAAARHMALQGAVVRIGRAPPPQDAGWRRIPGMV